MEVEHRLRRAHGPRVADPTAVAESACGGHRDHETCMVAHLGAVERASVDEGARRTAGSAMCRGSSGQLGHVLDGGPGGGADLVALSH